MIIDQFGNPFPPEALVRPEPEAGPTLAGVRQVVSGSPAAGLTPNRLAVHSPGGGRGRHHGGDGAGRGYRGARPPLPGRALHPEAFGQPAAHPGRSGERRSRARGARAVRPRLAQERHARAGAVRHAGRDRQGVQRSPRSPGRWTPPGSCRASLTYRTPRWFEVNRWDGETVMLRDLAATPEQLLAPLDRRPGRVPRTARAAARSRRTSSSCTSTRPRAASWRAPAWLAWRPGPGCIRHSRSATGPFSSRITACRSGSGSMGRRRRNTTAGCCGGPSRTSRATAPPSFR